MLAAVAAPLIAVGAGGLVLVGATPAVAESQTFFSTGAQQEYAVPVGTQAVTITAVGARGGTAAGLGGYGAEVTATVPLPPDTTTLYVEVGGAGGSGVGGFNGGGSVGSTIARGGGGASDVRTEPSTTALATSDTRMVVAGGGGGGGANANCSLAGNGGSAGDPLLTGAGAGGRGDWNMTCASYSFNPNGGNAGFGGVAGGAAGLGALNPAASPGSLGSGGRGGTLFGGGGGGGGGYFGGGGGGHGTSLDGGGGAGSSFWLSAATYTSMSIDTSGTARVTITPFIGTSVPSLPTGVSGIPGNASVDLSWNEPAWNGGSPITGYVVTPYVAAVAQAPSVFSTADTTQTIVGLANGTAYTFKVAATNAMGTGAVSAQSAAVTPRTVPGAPTNVSATRQNASASVSWTAPTDNGGSAITGYRVTTYFDGAPQGTNDVGTTYLHTTVTGLTNGSTYTFTVAAKNAAGTGPESEVSAPVTPLTTPAPPTELVAVPHPSAGSLTVSWTAPVNDGGSAVTGYDVQGYLNGVGGSGLWISWPTSTATTHTVGNLTVGSSYTFTVRSRNVLGTGSASALSSPVTVGVPGVPTAVTGQPGDGQVVLTWTAPSANGGYPVTGYVVTPYIGTVAQGLHEFASTATSQAITGLTNGTEYTFKVAARNSIGTGVQSGASGAVTPVATSDTVAPTVTYVTSSTAYGSYNAGDVISVYVHFSEVVTVAGTPNLTLDTGATDRVVNYTSGSGTSTLTFDYTVQAGDTSAHLEYIGTGALDVNGGTITDAVGNDAVLTLPAPATAGSLGGFAAIVIDTTAPSVTIDQASGQADPTSGSTVNFTVVFSEPVTGFATADVLLSGGAGATTAVVSGSGATYNVAVSGMTSDGTVVASIVAGAAKDAADNDSLASTSTDHTVTYNAPDTTAPSVTIDQASGQADPTSTSPVDFTVVFSEPVTGFVTGDVVLSGTAGATSAVVSGSGTTYNVAVSGMTGSGTVIASIDAGVAVDAADNPNTVSTSTDHTVTYNAPDTTAPTVTTVTSAASGAYKAGADVYVQVQFSEPVIVTGTPQLTLETGTVDRTVDYSSTTGSTLFFKYTVQAGDTSSDLDYVSSSALTLNGGAIKDAAGNDAVLALASPGSYGSLGANRNIVIDTTAPTVTIDQATGQADPTSSSPVDFTVVFSEPVTGFVTGDVVLSGTAGATTAVVSGSGTTYNVAVSGMTGSGTVIASVNAGVAVDAADNPNTASTSTDHTVTYNAPDTTAPTVTIDQATGQADPTSTSPVDFTVVFSEPVTGFVTGDVVLSGTAGATTAVVSGSGTTYNVAVSGMTGSGTVIASIDAGVAVDAADNPNTASTSTDHTVTYNAPTNDPLTAIASLRQDVVALNLGKTGDRLLSPLDRASAAVTVGKPTVALRQLDSFSKTVEALRLKTTLTQAQADHLKGHVDEIVLMLQP